MRDHIILFINGREHRVAGRTAFSTLSNYLRYELGLTGTKVVCEEGDCGACTVLVGRARGEELSYQPVNSCIQALCQLDGTSIITVEGLENGGELTPVQQAMVRCHGAQCGYCTPGFIVAMTALFENCDRVDEDDVRDGLTGNLCRCTGYEPIIRAALEVEGEKLQRARDFYPVAPLVHALNMLRSQAVMVVDGLRRFFAPTSLEDAVAVRQEFAPVTILQGGTDFGVWVNKRNYAPPALLSLGNVKGLDQITETTGEVAIGANVTLASIESWIRERFQVPGSEFRGVASPEPGTRNPEPSTAAFNELATILHVFGSPQIKNAGTLAGNIANASPIADTLPFLFVMDARIELAGPAGRREVAINNFYKGYKKLDMAAEEIITRVIIPTDVAGARSGLGSEELPRPAPSSEILKLYKVSRRRDLDIAAFTAAIRLQMRGDTIEGARIAFGGVGPVVLRMTKTEEFFKGRKPTLDLFEQAGPIARGEIAPITDVRGSSDFRFQLAENIFCKFWYEAFGIDRGEPASRRQSPGVSPGDVCSPESRNQ
jgi:xanthine dehydrogenase small subunit